MKILGIGNAIVDVICKVEDSFLEQNSLSKSTMKLVEENEFKKTFISGLGAWVLFQSVLNLGASVYLLPITGIVLPFVSYGGTAMVSIFVALGIMHCRVDE